MLCFVLAVAVADVVLELETPILIKLGQPAASTWTLSPLVCCCLSVSISHLHTPHPRWRIQLPWPIRQYRLTESWYCIIRSTINNNSKDPRLHLLHFSWHFILHLLLPYQIQHVSVCFAGKMLLIPGSSCQWRDGQPRMLGRLPATSGNAKCRSQESHFF